MDIRDSAKERETKESILKLLLEACQTSNICIAREDLLTHLTIDESNPSPELDSTINNLEKFGLISLEPKGFRITAKGIDYLISADSYHDT